MKRDAGDFQTPPGLVSAVLDRVGPGWPRVLEPTCGRGHFLRGLLDKTPPPSEILGIELQDEHYRTSLMLAEGARASTRIGIRRCNIFDMDLSIDLNWEGRGPLLVVGNPPWVTNAELGHLGSANLPAKSNFKRDRGLDAKTGASNFDIAEAIWLKLLTELAGEDATIALLTKTSVARRVLEHAHREGWPVASAEVVRIDAKTWFGVAVEACLLTVRLGPRSLDRIPVFDRLDAREPVAEMGFVNGRLVDDLDAYAPFRFADGMCHLTWRQGLKHDAAGVMELTPNAAGLLQNERAEVVDVEPEHVYPLLKGTDLARPAPAVPSRSVIVTQDKVGQDTHLREHDSPRLWRYLNANAPAFDRRKSSIYRNGPPFAMFGVGPYSFAPYKIAVSGLHRHPRFHAVGPVEGRPVMVDDTCYSLACESPEQAGLGSALLNSAASIGLLRSLTFPGAKRPVTKAVLQRVDLLALLQRADRAAILASTCCDVERLTGSPLVEFEPSEFLLTNQERRG